jgi:hypothetical protein
MIIQEVTDAILRRIIDPLFYGNLFLRQNKLLIFFVFGLFEHALTFHPLYFLRFYRCLKTTIVSFGVHESVLAFVLLQWELFAINHVIVSV